MQSVVNAVASWPDLFGRALTEHTLAAAVVTIAAIGIFVVLQQELRPYSLVTNVAFVAAGWLVSMSSLVFVMRLLRRAWAAVEGVAPLVGKLSAYLYGICERHPILALVIVGAGTTAYFLRQPWPPLVAWGPVRAVCAVLGVALGIHIAGPIADLVSGEAPGPVAARSAEPEKLPAVSAQQAVAQAVQAGDTRYVSVRSCVDEVAGYPASADPRSPWGIGVKPLGRSCYESLGHEAAARLNKQRAYAAQYNQLMYEHNRSVRGPVEQLGYAADGRGVHR